MLNAVKSRYSSGKNSIFLISFALCFLFFGICEAQWVQVSNGMGNVNVYSLAYSGNNIFAGTDNYGVYLSTNNGTTWSQTSLNNRSVGSLVVSGNYVFAGIDLLNGVYLSTDNGTTWAQTALNNQVVRSLAVNGNNVFVGTYPGSFYVSNNNGASWTQRNEGLGNATVYALTILNNYIFAGTEANSVYRRPLTELIGIKPISEQVPSHYALEQNYPNPFNPKTVISFQLPVSSNVKLIVYDVLGREAATLVNEPLKPGTYEVDFDGTNYPSGVYFYALTAGEFRQTRKMVLVK